MNNVKGKLWNMNEADDVSSVLCLGILEVELRSRNYTEIINCQFLGADFCIVLKSVTDFYFSSRTVSENVN